MIYLHINTICVVGVVQGKLEGAMNSGKIEGTKENQRKMQEERLTVPVLSDLDFFSFFKGVINLWLIVSFEG